MKATSATASDLFKASLEALSSAFATDAAFLVAASISIWAFILRTTFFFATNGVVCEETIDTVAALSSKNDGVAKLFIDLVIDVEDLIGDFGDLLVGDSDSEPLSLLRESVVRNIVVLWCVEQYAA